MRALLLLLLVGCGGPGLTRRQPDAKSPVAVASAPVPTAPTASMVFDDPEFTITFPAAFTAKHSSESVEQGTMAMSSISTVTNDTRYLAIKLIIDNAAYNCTKGLDAMRDETMDREHCTLTSEKKIELKGNPARDVQFECAENRKGSMLLVCDASKSASKHHTVYDLSASGPASFADSHKQFLSSFVLK